VTTDWRHKYVKCFLQPFISYKPDIVKEDYSKHVFGVPSLVFIHFSLIGYLALPNGTIATTEDYFIITISITVK
jgi:hypothetical protein